MRLQFSLHVMPFVTSRRRYDEQHDNFLKVQAEMKEVKAACEQTIVCMEALVKQNALVAEKFQNMFPSGGQFVSVGSVRRAFSAQQPPSPSPFRFN